MSEIWKDIEGYEGRYQVSNMGRVRSLSRKVLFGNQTRMVSGKILKLKRSMMKTLTSHLSSLKY